MLIQQIMCMVRECLLLQDIVFRHRQQEYTSINLDMYYLVEKFDLKGLPALSNFVKCPTTTDFYQ